MSELIEEVESLIKKANKKGSTSLEALQFSQAAVNSANALRCIDEINIAKPKK